MARRKWLLLASSVILVGVAAAAFSFLRRGSALGAAAAHAPQPAAPVAGDLTLPVRIRARHLVAVAAPGAGTVEAFFADAGEEVYEGQLLAHISDPGLAEVQAEAKTASEEAQARAAQLEAVLLTTHLESSRARANAERAKAERDRTGKLYQRQKMLFGEGATPRLVYEKAEREAAQAAKEFDSLEVLARHAETRVSETNEELRKARRLADEKAAELDHTDAQMKSGDVLSPVDGMVLARRGEIGKPLAEGDTADLFEIAVNLMELEAVLEAEPSALARLAPRTQAMLFFADIPGEGLPSTLREIHGNQAIFDFTSPNPVIRPGMTAHIRVALR